MRGTSFDNGTITKVVVNGTSAKALRPNFAEWEVVLSKVGREVTVRARAYDAAGNTEPAPHEVVWRRP
ncbi:MAG: hypothetical protein FJ303_26540 [Planctomycetes bacterium]|nr:hypothetical protein [Planctomycetota bacterium]